MKSKIYVPIFLSCIMVFLTGCGKEQKVNKQIITVNKYDKNAYDVAVAERGDISPELTINLTADKYIRKTYFPVYDGMEIDNVYVETGEQVAEGDVLITFKSEDTEEKIKMYQEEIDQNQLLIDHYRKLSEIDSTLDYKVDIDQLTRSIQVDNLYISELKAKQASYSIISEGKGIVFSVAEGLNNGTVDTSFSLITVIYGDETFSAEIDDDYPFQENEVYEAYYGDVSYDVLLTDITEQNGKRLLSFELYGENRSFCNRDKLYLTLSKPLLKDVVYIPDKCVVTTDDNKTYVYILDDNGYRDIREVVVSNIVEGNAIIESGLSEGDRVAIQ